jgi:hypothetical protein
MPVKNGVPGHSRLENTIEFRLRQIYPVTMYMEGGTSRLIDLHTLMAVSQFDSTIQNTKY